MILKNRKYPLPWGKNIATYGTSAFVSNAAKLQLVALGSEVHHALTGTFDNHTRVINHETLSPAPFKRRSDGTHTWCDKCWKRFKNVPADTRILSFDSRPKRRNTMVLCTKHGGLVHEVRIYFMVPACALCSRRPRAGGCGS